MKKLAITSVAVLIALIGFIAVLCFLPGDKCCGKQEGCQMHEQKCSDEKGKCESKHEGCGKGHGHHDGCGNGQEKRMVREWKDADGKVHKEVKVIIGGEGDAMDMGSGCPMENGDHSGCCGCCMMKHGGHTRDSMEVDSVRVKVRGKL